MRTQEQVNEIVRLLLAEYPEAVCSLDWGKDYELLFSVRLSAQCTDERVNQVTPALFRRFPTLEAFAEADISEVEELIHSCGFFRAKARDIVNLLLGDLYRVPGSVVVDTHCIRISNRLGLVDNVKEPEKIEAALREILPPESSSDFCHCIVLHGRAVCDARKPLCGNCCVRGLCQAYEQGTVLQRTRKA